MLETSLAVLLPRRIGAASCAAGRALSDLASVAGTNAGRSSRDRLARGALALAFSACCIAAPSHAASALGSYNVKLDETSISGISSGAYMAVQFAVAHSAIIRGVGAIAGGPYYCGQNDLNIAYRSCMVGYPAYPSAPPLVTTAQGWATAGDIDPLTNLAAQKVWVFHGYNDGVVKKGVTDVLLDFYASFTGAAHVFYKDNLPAAHAQVTTDWGQACSQTGGDFVNKCGYDAAGLLLQHIYGTLNPPNAATLSGAIVSFDQTKFYSGDIASIGMASTGYAYVPAACSAQQPCRIHVALHGCKQYAGAIGSDYYMHAGYNPWADTNQIIVLYPQTIATTSAPTNPNGCWDWWGYTNGNYAKKSGPQIGAIMAMIQRLAGGYTGWKSAPAGTFGPPANVAAADSSATRVDLHWTPVAGAAGYRTYRALCAGCAFTSLTSAPVPGASFGDAGLTASTTYYYRVRAVDSSGNESADSATVSIATAPPPPACDPYYRSNYDHWYEQRAYTDWFNLNIYANGSNQWLGYTGPGSLVAESFLRKTGTNYYVLGVCQ